MPVLLQSAQQIGLLGESEARDILLGRQHECRSILLQAAHSDPRSIYKKKEQIALDMKVEDAALVEAARIMEHRTKMCCLALNKAVCNKSLPLLRNAGYSSVSTYWISCPCIVQPKICEVDTRMGGSHSDHYST